jgi:predicted nucleic-acid-binding Zn-ribbon protein
MSEGEPKKCPKCGAVFSRAKSNNSFMQLFTQDSFPMRGFGDNIVPFYCTNCGYIELYSEKYLKKQ